MNRNEVQVALVRAAGVLPRGGGNGGKVRIVLGCVAGQIGRQVSRLGLQELGQA